MASRTITYVWKIPRPKNEGVARLLMAAAYETAVQTDANVTHVLIRSRIHGSTKTGGWYRPDFPHITIAVKNNQTQQHGSHQASHGYTANLNSAQVVRVKSSGSTKADSIRDVWPQGLPQEELQGNPANLGHGFVSWDPTE